MTDIRKSDAQLDAEATTPSPPLAPRIALHRRLAKADGYIVRLHVQEGDDQGIGVPFNEQFVRYLEERYGTQYPWQNGLRTVRTECRRSHSDHWERPEWDGSLCYRLVSLVCRYDYSFSRACYELHVDPDRTEAVMQRALRRIEERLDELQARATSTVESDKGRHDWMAPAHVHRPLDGLHREDCPQCRRAAA